MKKLLIMMLAVVAATSCIKEGKNSFSWTKAIVGTMTTADARTGQTVYSTETAQAQIELPDGFTNSINFHLDNVKFVEMMPAVSIVIPDLKFKVEDLDWVIDKNGIYVPTKYAWVIDQNDVIPTVGGVPYETYKMSVVKGYITDDTIKLDFWLTFGDTPYHVTFVKESPDEEEPNKRIE